MPVNARPSMTARERNAANLRNRAAIQMAAARWYKQAGNVASMQKNVAAARTNTRLARLVLGGM